MQIYERPLLKKLQLEQNFPCKMLYARRSALGVSLVKPRTIITMAIIKQYIGCTRTQNNASQLIEAINEILIVRNGFSQSPIDQIPDQIYNKVM